MGNWIPNDPTLVARILKISSSYSPPPPEGFISPMTWGIEGHVIERFTGAGIHQENISFTRATYTFDFPGAPSGILSAFRNYYGPTMNAFEAAEKDGRAADLLRELEDLFERQNTSERTDQYMRETIRGPRFNMLHLLAAPGDASLIPAPQPLSFLDAEFVS